MENIDIDKEISENIDIDKISNRLEFGISNRATQTCYSYDKFPSNSLTKRGIFCNDDILSKHARTTSVL